MSRVSTIGGFLAQTSRLKILENFPRAKFAVHQKSLASKSVQSSRISVKNMSGNSNRSGGSKGSPFDSKIVSVENSNQGKWIQTRKINYQDPAGNLRVWEMAIRTTRTKTTNIDAVSIVAILRNAASNSINPSEINATRENHIVLTKQFRPPVGKVVIEMPAGLIDPSETIETTAIRELIEETGYFGTFKSLSETFAELVSDPGLTNANMALAYVDVDLSDPRNKDPVAQLEDGEFIETFTVPMSQLLAELNRLATKENCSVDARLYHFAMGIDLAQKLSSTS